MRYISLFCILMIFPALVHANALRVQTGEHATFTRVVIDMPAGVEWELGRMEDGYLLRLPTPSGFDLDEFFDRIPRERILAVSQTSSLGELRFLVECLCHAQAEIYRSNYLVIDIRDGPAPTGSPFEVSIVEDGPATTPEKTSQRTAASVLAARNSILPIITPRLGGRVQLVDTPEAQEIAPTPAVPEADTAQTPHAEKGTDATLQIFVETLGDSLGRGLSDGLLQEGFAPFRDDTFHADGTGAFATLDSGMLPGLNARTSIDPLAVNSAIPQPETQVGQICLPDSSFDIASWGDDSPPHLQLRNARNALVTPADQIEDGALYAFARLYIYLGFGHEARKILDLEGVQSRDRVLLRTVARIIDNEPVNEDLFSGQVSCPSHVALWALLAQPKAPVDAAVDRTAVVNAYRALPAYVKGPIAPRLAEALVGIGAEDAAIQVLGLQSTALQKDVELVLANAALSDALGEEDDAIDKVKDVARNDRRVTPAAMSRFLSEGAAEGIVFSDADFLLADAMRFEFAGSPAAKALTVAQFDAYLSMDRFSDARDLLDAHSNEMLEDERNLRRAQLFQQATDRLSDAAFLEFFWQDDLQRDTIETQNVVGARLLGLQFPEQALTVMTGDARGASAVQQSALRAEAMRDVVEQRSLEGSNIEGGERTAVAGQTPDLRASGNATLRNSRALVASAEQSRETIRALLQTVPIPMDF